MLVPYLIVAGTGLLMALVGLPLWLQKVRPNWLYGFRTPRTVSSEALWYASNKVGGRDLALAGLAQLLLSALAVAASLPEVFIGVVSVVPVLIAVLHSTWAISSMAYAMDNSADSSEAAAAARSEVAAAAAKGEAARRARQTKTAA